MRHIPRAAYAALICSVFAGCATTEPVTKGRAAIPVACQEPVPDRPVMATDALPLDASLDAYVASAESEIKDREAYEIKMRTALESCTKPIDGTATPP